SASGSHAGGAAAAAGTCARSVVAPGTPGTSSEGIPVSATATREIPAANAIRSSSPRSITPADSAAGPVAEATTTTTSSTSGPAAERSEEHTSELQSRFELVCRLLLEKKKEI